MFPVLLPSFVFSDTHSTYHLETISVIISSSTYATAFKGAVPSVPYYSQFADITSSKWQKVGCGITSLAMLIEYYKPNLLPNVDVLLTQGVKAGAYSSAGWTYSGLVGVAKTYGLSGESFDLGSLTSGTAFEKFKKSLASGPVIASVHYKFDPKSTIPHLVVITGSEGDTLYYNDPAGKSGGTISKEKFLKAWKKRYIVVRPAEFS